jgi:vitamin B12 transporter
VKRWQYFFGLLGLVRYAPAIAAQQPDSTILPRVVVTATRVDAPIAARVPAVTVLDGQLLRLAGVRDVAEALRLVPGVAIVRSGGPGAITSLFMRGGESDYVKVLVDGVPVNDPGGAVDLAWLSLDNVDRIEVVRGPASVLYGSDAVAGVVQIFTRRGSGRLAVDGELAAGSYGSRRWELQSSASRSDRGNLALGAAGQHTDGHLAFNSSYDQQTISWQGALLLGRRTSLASSARYSDDEFHYPTDGAGRVVDRNAFRRDRRALAQATLGHDFGKGWRLEASLAGLDGRGRNDDAPDGPADSSGFYAYFSDSHLLRRSATAQLHWLRGERSALTLGAEWSLERLRSSDSSNYSSAWSQFRGQRHNRAAYLQWLASAGRLSFSAGARYDDNDTFGAFRTARAGVAIDLWKGGTLRLAGGTAFKAPTFYETFNTAFSLGNPLLRPERSLSWEGGVRQQLAAGLAVAVDAFSQRFRDLIQYTYRSPNDPNYFNVARAAARGIEVEASWIPSRLWRASVAATFLHTRVDDAGFDSGPGATFVQGNRLLRRPDRLLSTTLVATPGRSTSVALTARYVGERDDRDFSSFPAKPVVLPSYLRLDGNLVQQLGHLGSHPMSLTLRVENILGRGYQEVANFALPGRTVTIGLRSGQR